MGLSTGASFVCAKQLVQWLNGDRGCRWRHDPGSRRRCVQRRGCGGVGLGSGGLSGRLGPGCRSHWCAFTASSDGRCTTNRSGFTSNSRRNRCRHDRSRRCGGGHWGSCGFGRRDSRRHRRRDGRRGRLDERLGVLAAVHLHICPATNQSQGCDGHQHHPGTDLLLAARLASVGWNKGIVREWCDSIVSIDDRHRILLKFGVRTGAIDRGSAKSSRP